MRRVGDQTAVEPLVESLKDESWRVRLEAASALGQIGDEKATGPLISAFEDGDPAVRWSAMQAFTGIGEVAVEPLVEALRHRQLSVRTLAAGALGNIRDKRAVEPLLELLKSKNASFRHNIAEALKKITKRDFDDDYEKWKEWYESSRDK